MMNKSERQQYMRKYYIDHREKLTQYQHDHREELRSWGRHRYYARGGQPMSENRSCSLFLGVHVAEQLLYNLFEDVTRMPYGNPGYDFRCAKDYLVDCKASCNRTLHGKTPKWCFSIRYNTIADYFLCVAFDDRERLNPLHIWLIPGKILSHRSTACISESTLNKWSEYEKPIDVVIDCCNSLKGCQ